ncbi:hypothetical protein GCM10010869_51690 [Mesorhizobium tianshanense]|uniref:Uncharacterized protein n=1 Tax=Mesorhizobium tianshanense TaxID=39844 RepID=A0A562PFG0_9HYPH|nr:hypothetical protein IQ26_00135 [Mesorhizobium tianshanense]GLS39572.1 hypothetical protein GCM10010869_51690 [Mesorhizobium tianshanense]
MAGAAQGLQTMSFKTLNASTDEAITAEDVVGRLDRCIAAHLPRLDKAGAAEPDKRRRATASTPSGSRNRRAGL